MVRRACNSMSLPLHGWLQLHLVSELSPCQCPNHHPAHQSTGCSSICSLGSTAWVHRYVTALAHQSAVTGIRAREGVPSLASGLGLGLTYFRDLWLVEAWPIGLGIGANPNPNTSPQAKLGTPWRARRSVTVDWCTRTVTNLSTGMANHASLSPIDVNIILIMFTLTCVILTLWGLTSRDPTRMPRAQQTSPW